MNIIGVIVLLMVIGIHQLVMYLDTSDKLNRILKELEKLKR